jgi:hypothetical protein
LSPPRARSLSTPRAVAIGQAALAALISFALPSPSSASETGIPEGWVSFDDVTQTATAPALEIVSSDLSELVLRVTTPGVVSTTVREDGTDYGRLEFPGYYHSTEVGHPLLPAVRQLIAVPEGCEIQVSVSLGDSAVWSGTVIYPVEAAVIRYTEEGWPYIAYEFARDNDAYHATLLKSATDHQPTERPVTESVRVVLNGVRCDEVVTLKPGG